MGKLSIAYKGQLASRRDNLRKYLIPTCYVRGVLCSLSQTPTAIHYFMSLMLVSNIPVNSEHLECVST